MLSKILPVFVFALTVSHVRGGADTVDSTINFFTCQIANAVSADDALAVLNSMVDDIADKNPATFTQETYLNLADIDANNLWEDAKNKCVEDSPLPECTGADGEINDGPGANCQQRAVNLAVVNVITGGYGCWCNLFHGDYSRILDGKGRPLDVFDTFCRDLTESYKCIISEYYDETGLTCDPWNVGYTVTPAVSTSSNAVTTATLTCDNIAGATSCQKKACYVEVLFAVRYVAATFGLSVSHTDLPYAHATSTLVGWLGVNPAGQFVADSTTCPTQGSTTHRYCCGVYPFRKRYASADSNTECCGEDEYNSSTHKCCNDPEHMGIGTVELITSNVCV